MNQVSIKRTPNADTRSLETLDKNLVYLDTEAHIAAVFSVLKALSSDLIIKGLNHDKTKLKYFNEFFDDLSTKKTGAEFKALPWWKKHMKERHHLNDSCPEDVNLLDVLEMVADCVCAGLARTGNVFPIEISNEILQKALKNTVEMIKENIKVTD